MPGARRLGTAAEDRAANYLIEKGYTLVTRRYRARSGELDLVALDGDVLVFVEVKERRSEGAVPEESISRMKANRIRSAAREYLAASGEAEREFRFDVISIDPSGVRHHRDVFQLGYQPVHPGEEPEEEWI